MMPGILSFYLYILSYICKEIVCFIVEDGKKWKGRNWSREHSSLRRSQTRVTFRTEELGGMLLEALVPWFWKLVCLSTETVEHWSHSQSLGQVQSGRGKKKKKGRQQLYATCNTLSYRILKTCFSVLEIWRRDLEKHSYLFFFSP